MIDTPKIAIASILTGLIAFGGLALSVLHSVTTQAGETALNDVILTGGVKSAPGEKMEGVEVSAKAEGHTITTTVLTDASGHYYFPPLPGGRYRVWAQAVGYGTGRADLELQQKVQGQDFVLNKIDDFTPQLRGDQWLAALPEDTPQHRKMKDVFKYNCVECHGADFVLQNKFDEQGWTKIITTMSRISSTGIRDLDHAPAPIIQFYKSQLASYLAEMRGPGSSPMHFMIPPRTTGEAATVVFREYDVPPDFHGGYGVPASDGSDWSLGTPSRLNGNGGIHDSQIDFDGNIWFTYTEPSMDRSVGKIDARTGKVTNYKVPGGPDGTAQATHGVTVGPDGDIYFDASPRMYPGSRGGPGSLVQINPRTGKMDVYSPPEGQPGVGGQLFVNQAGDVCSTDRASGALVFHSATHTFTPLHADPFTETEGDNFSYGAAFDRDGNCWWTQYYVDAVSVGYAKTGKIVHINFPKVPSLSDGLLNADERQLYAAGVILGQQPGAQGTKRMYADRNGDSIWIGDYWGNNLAEIDTHTMKVSYHEIPIPNAQPYAVIVDSNHKVWTNLQQADRIVEIDPETGQWTVYPTSPTLGYGSPHLGISEHNGRKQFSMSYNRVSKVGVMEVRTDEALQSLKNQVQGLEKK
jgi:streptogramin lyase